MDEKQLQRATKLLPTCKALLTLKYGARNSRPDLSMLQQVHDMTVKLGAVCGDGLKKNAFFVEQHLPGKHNQKAHGNRFGGYSTTKESLRRLKGDKEARERYKARARALDKKIGKKTDKKTAGVSILSEDEKGKDLDTRLTFREKTIKDNPIESAFIFNKKGELVLRKDGNEDSVSFSPDEIKKMSGTILTHNHPGDNSFSPEDVYFLKTADLAEVRAVGKKYRHSMRVKKDTLLNLDVVEDKIKNADHFVKEVFWRDIMSGTMTPDEASANHWHEVWTMVSSDTNLEYKREEW